MITCNANYIKACKPKETDISECIKQRVEELREQLNDGIPEMRIPSINPLEIPFAQMDLGEKSKASMKDIKLYGLPAFIIKDLKIDLDKDYIEIKVDIPHIRAEGEYTVKGKLLILTLDGSGPGQINIRDVLQSWNLLRHFTQNMISTSMNPIEYIHRVMEFQSKLSLLNKDIKSYEDLKQINSQFNSLHIEGQTWRSEEQQQQGLYAFRKLPQATYPLRRIQPTPWEPPTARI
ncbi:uncharacterized protein LOC114345266 [Diabrotica virgifera virgifera]|uniref:Circadian clock-controlled protein-like n=1 Tax=Diabrotica virgifera virgifera TaxID=50390 RepID=A0ABM5JZM5_DIAVI|nr:uncharacterized protein LOC114345266 [Diabrotica virgifera virgifera]